MALVMDVWVEYAQHVFKRQDGEASCAPQPACVVLYAPSCCQPEHGFEGLEAWLGLRVQEELAEGNARV